VERYGVGNLIIATAMSGVFLFLMGLLRLGTLVRFIPVAVIIGFTNGIAVLVALSQIKDFLGLRIAKMPGDFFGIVSTLWTHLDTFNGWALAVAAASLAVIVLWQHGGSWLKTARVPVIGPILPFGSKLSSVPGSIVALTLATAAVAAFDLPVETIGTRFGGIPAALPAFALPDFSWGTARYMLMPAITLALLGSIESLLCARVADGMIDDRHNPNQELMAQGIANFVTPFFGGMPATGTIARTVTNVKSGATSPVAGMVHALALLAVILVAAPLASSIPLATLAAILMFVAWNMGEWREFVRLRSYRMPYRVTLLAVFLLTVVFDLTVAVEFGIAAACLTFIYRISSLSRAEQLDAATTPRLAGHEGQLQVWRLYGALFFGATKVLENMEDHLPARALVLDLKNVIYVDSTGAEALVHLARAGDLWWKPLRQTFTAEIIAPLAPIKIIPATLGTTAPIIGAARGACARGGQRFLRATDAAGQVGSQTDPGRTGLRPVFSRHDQAASGASPVPPWPSAGAPFSAEALLRRRRRLRVLRPDLPVLPRLSCTSCSRREESASMNSVHQSPSAGSTSFEVQRSSRKS